VATTFNTVRLVERLNYLFGGILIIGSVFVATQSQALGLAIGVVLTCLNFAVLRGLVSDGTLVPVGVEGLKGMAEVSRWILPSDGLWRGVIYGLEPPLVLLIAAGEAPDLANANPFYAPAPPPLIFVIWSVAWIALVLGLAARSFERRDL